MNQFGPVYTNRNQLEPVNDKEDQSGYDLHQLDLLEPVEGRSPKLQFGPDGTSLDEGPIESTTEPTGSNWDQQNVINKWQIISN